ncbi:MAG TPA: MFS transporter [Bacteroidales bacterium]|nr:MFS transporter [Bacteroidales bacterium]
MKREHIFKKLYPNEARTFVLHLFYSVFEGSLFGAFLMNEFVFLKSLQGSSYMLGVLFVFSMAVFSLLIFGNELLRRNSDKRKLLRVTALVTRLPLLAFLFFPADISVYTSGTHWHFAFMGIFLIFYLGTPVTYPTMNLLLRHNYRSEIFGKLFGYANTVSKLFAFVATFVFGWMLEHNYSVFRYVYPACGIMGLLSLWSLSSVPYVVDKPLRLAKGFLKSIKQSMHDMKNILVRDKDFFQFELSFMIYGIGFMLTVAAVTLYLESELALSYFSYAAYRNYAAVLTIVTMPLFSRVIDKTDPRRFARMAYILMLFYILLILITEWIPWHVNSGIYQIFPTLLLAFTFMGVFNGSMGILWYIGSSYYCNDKSLSGDYQSVHLSFVGIRALIAPLLGVYFYESFGYVFTFAFAIFILLIAISITVYSQLSRPIIR